MTAVTAEDGTYSFAGQDAGYYTVVRMPLEGLVGTTPAEMAVILVEIDGIVSDFLLANFGVIRGEDPGDDFVKVGDFVTAKGAYFADPDRLVAEIFNVSHCDSMVSKDGGDDGDSTMTARLRRGLRRLPPERLLGPAGRHGDRNQLRGTLPRDHGHQGLLPRQGPWLESRRNPLRNQVPGQGLSAMTT